jgi:RimJ/RimL family protein N-acetyltransferase
MRCQAAAAGGQAVRHHGPVTSIHLRPIIESDLPVLDRLAADPRIAGPFDWHGFGDPGARRRRLAEDGYLGRDPRNLAIALDQDDSCIGHVSWLAVPTGPTSTCWNIGIVIVPEFRGKGYGTTAQRLLTGYLFATTTANRVEAGTDVENLAEQRALEKAVFAMIPHQRPATDRRTLKPRTGSSTAGPARDLAMPGRSADSRGLSQRGRTLTGSPSRRVN